nr:tRNA (adenosine(37)-N6)-threonylcarbamoyltransferase complex dimerization subunit type 1 TsaB [Bacteroidaceae bacterium]
VYDRALCPLRDIQADVVTEETYKAYLDKSPVYFFGDGAQKCKEVLNHPNAHFIPNIRPLAKHMAPLAEQAFVRGLFEDVAYFEPFYLKAFVAGKPRNILREVMNQ